MVAVKLNLVPKTMQGKRFLKKMFLGKLFSIPKYIDDKTGKLEKLVLKSETSNLEIKNLLVICPGFASDCVETLEEINIQGRESFLEHGGENFDLIPCLNDSDDHIDLFAKLVTKYI